MCIYTLFLRLGTMIHWLQNTSQQLSCKNNRCETSNLPASLWVLWYRLAQTLQEGPDEQKRGGIKRKKEGGKEKGWRDKTKVYTDRAQSPLVADPGGQPDLGNTLWGLLLDLSLTPIKGLALESCPAAPQSPIFMFVLVAQWPPPSNLAMARTQQGETKGRSSF